MRFLLSVFACLMLGACTFNVSMAHTSGTASDTIDDTQTNEPVVSPTVSLPIKAI